MKLKEIKGNLVGIKVVIPKEYEDNYQNIKGEMFIFGMWSKGLWLKKNMKEERIYPLCMDDVKQALEFKVVKEN